MGKEWFNLLPLELQAVETLIEPTEEVRPTDTVVGECPLPLRKMSTLCSMMDKESQLLQVETKFRKATPEETARIGELKAKSVTLGHILWVSIADEFGLWGHLACLEMRAGWKVVEYERPMTPFFQLFQPGQGG